MVPAAPALRSGPLIFRDEPEPHDRTRMPTSTRRPNPYERAGSAEVNAMVERVAPAVLELLADGMPRSKAAIVEALAGRHDKQDVVHTLIRLAVTGQVEEKAQFALAVGIGRAAARSQVLEALGSAARSSVRRQPR